MEKLYQSSKHCQADGSPLLFTSIREGSWVLFASIVGTAMPFIDSTGINTILPLLHQELGTKITQAQWIMVSYALFISSLILFGGALSDKLGRKKVFIAGLISFALFSLWCGLAPSANNLIVARAFQGIGGALLIPSSLALLTVSFDAKIRGRALGIWAGSVAATAALGPVLGGWLAENYSWRYLFFINIPITLVILPVLLWKIENDSDLRPVKLDLIGSLLASCSLGFLVFGLIESPNMGYYDLRTIGSLVFGLILGVIFIYYEKRIKEPLVPMELFHSKTFTGANIVSFLFWFSWNAVIFYLPFGFIQLYGYSAVELAISFLPGFLSLLLFASFSGELIRIFSVRTLLIAGFLTVSVSFYLFSLPGMSVNYTKDLLIGILLMGAGIGISSSPMVTAVVGSQDKKYSGLVSGINNAVGRIGGLMGITITGLIGINLFNVQLDERLVNIALDADVIETLKAERIKLVAAKIPESLDAETTKAVRFALDSSFHVTLTFMMKICAFICSVAAVLTCFLIDDSKIDT